MKSRKYKVVDVFTREPLLGNAVAVVLESEGLDTEAMKAIARWTNLSETTFVLPPTAAGADYRLRIFSPRSELPFAGHPTLGSAHAAIEAGIATPRAGKLVEECGVGLIRLEVQDTPIGRRVFLELPASKVQPVAPDVIGEVEAILSCAVLITNRPAIIDVGPRWLVCQVASVQSLLAIRPDLIRCAALEKRLQISGLTVFATYPAAWGESLLGPSIEVRSFAPSSGIDEDPVCGSGNGSVAVFLRDHKQFPAAGASYLASQGQCVNRSGVIDVNVAPDGAIKLGGACVTGIDGVLRLS